MLILILCWIFLGYVCLSVGIAIVPREEDNSVELSDRMIFTLWLGLILVALALLALAIYAPLQPWITFPALFATALLLLVPGRNRSILKQYIGCYRGLPVRSWKFCLVLALTALVVSGYSSQQVTFFDTGLYHYQMVAILRQYGVLKGAALIHQRFGFSSSWFALATPFPAQTISGLTMLIVFGHLLALLRRIYQGVRTGMPESGQHSYRSRPADRFIVIAYLLAIPYLVMGNGLANSLSPDLPVAIGVIIFCWWILATGNSSRQRLSLMILALGLFAVKLSTLPLVLIAILNFLILSPLSWRRWLATGLLAILVSGPVLTVNILTSGCPLYPSGAGCLEQLPWSYSSAEAERLRQLSTNYARTEGRSAEIDPQGAWIIDWMIDDFTGSLTSMAFLTLVSVAAILLLLILYPRLEMRSEDRLVFTIGAVGLVYVLAMAPSLRFGIGYAVIIPSLILSRLNWKSSVLVPMIGSAVVLLTPFTELEHRKVRLAIMLVLTAIFLLAIILTRIQQIRLHFIFLVTSLITPLLSLWTADFKPFHPSEIRRPADRFLEKLDLGGASIVLTHYGSLGNQCWAAPAPCTPEMPLRPIGLIDQSQGLKRGVAFQPQINQE